MYSGSTKITAVAPAASAFALRVPLGQFDAFWSRRSTAMPCAPPAVPPTRKVLAGNAAQPSVLPLSKPGFSITARFARLLVGCGSEPEKMPRFCVLAGGVTGAVKSEVGIEPGVVEPTVV